MIFSFLPFAEAAKGRCPRSGRRGHGPHDVRTPMTPPSPNDGDTSPAKLGRKALP